MNNTGILIRKFREEKNITQQELEMAIDAAFGHISRIESGKINPSKETLLKIIKYLNLNDREKDQLLGMGIHYPTSEEIERAIIESKKYIDNCPNIAYMIHDLGFIYYANPQIERLFGLKIPFQEFYKKYYGVNVFEFLFDPNMSFRNSISKECFEQVILQQVKQFMMHINYPHTKNEEWFQKLFERWTALPGFIETWEKAEQMPKELRIHRERIMSIKIRNIEITFYLSDIHLNEPYFKIVEFIPVK